MPDTSKRVRIVSDLPGYPDGTPAVLVDGEPLTCVQRIEIDHTYDGGPAKVRITLIGVDVAMDLDGIPEYMVKVVGPGPR